MKHLYLLFLFFYSCSGLYSHKDIQNREGGEVDFNTVEIVDSLNSPNPEIKETKFVDGFLGPFPRIEDHYSSTPSEISKTPTLGVILGPGAHRALGHITLLKYLYKKDISIHLVSGHELGAVVASLYASGVTPERMEWLFYKFFNETKNNRIYSKKWFEKLNSIVLSQIKVDSIEKLKIATYLPSLTKRGLVGLYGKGDIKKVLISNIKMFANTGASRTKINYFGHKFFKKIGVNILIGVDVLGDNILFDKGDDYLTGIFGKTVSRIKLEKQNPTKKIYSLDLGNYPLDSYDDPSPYLKKSEKQSKEIVDDIFKTVKKWDNGQTGVYLKNYEKTRS